MASQHLTGTQLTSTPHLDGYLKGIRDEFDRLNHELEETRKQRDEFMTKYRNQVEELQELRQTISSRENNTVCQHSQDIAHTCGATDSDSDASPPTSPTSSSSDCYPTFEDASKGIGHFEGERDVPYQNEINVASAITGTSLQAIATPANKPEFSAWNVVFNDNTTVALNLNLVHKLTQEGRTRLAFSMDGKYLAAAGLGIVSIFDSKTGERIMHSVIKNPYHIERSLPSYRCIEFSPDSKYLATGDEVGVRIWTISRVRLRNMFSHRHVHSLDVSPNGRFIVTCSFGREVIIWRLRDGSSRVLSSSKFYPFSVRFSLDGRYVASGDTVGKMQIWSVRTGTLVSSWQAHSDLITSLAFTPDGNGLLSGSWDKQVIQWDVSSLNTLEIRMATPPISEVSRLIGHTGYIVTVSVSRDGKWITSGSRDRTMRIWNALDAKLHCILHRPESVSSVDFSPVGNYLAISAGSKGVTIWNYVNP